MKQGVLFLLLFFVATANAQEKVRKEFKNTIKYNVTNPFIFGKDVVILGYERVLNKHHTLMVNFGRTALPKIASFNADSINLMRSNKNSGLNFSAEYRFYLGKVNKYNAPRGVYLAPFYSYNSFRKENTWSLTKFDYNGEVNTDLSLKVQTVGVELGYQFVFWNRLAVDFVMLGPGFANYKLNAGINTTLSPANKLELFQNINDYLTEKLPGYNFVIPENEFTTTGSCSSNSFNFRYFIQIGFRF